MKIVRRDFFRELLFVFVGLRDVLRVWAQEVLSKGEQIQMIQGFLRLYLNIGEEMIGTNGPRTVCLLSVLIC